MKSFKKIALAMVAAMTTATIVATPASAAVMTVAVDLNGTANTTASAIATPALLPVPSDNKVEALDALRFVATVDMGTSVSVTATNAVIVSALNTLAAPVTALSGSSSLTIATGTGTTATFYVYTKTTAIGSVVISNQGTTLTYYVQGQAGKINNLNVTAPTSAAAGTKQDVIVEATDVFGNKISGKQITATVFASTGVLDGATVLTGSTLVDFGKATFKLTLPTTGTRSLLTFAPTVAADAVDPTVVTGLTAPTLSPFAEIAVRDMAAELKFAQDALAAEKAARAADKAAADKAAADAKVFADKAAADLVTANAEIVKLKADAVVAKAAADKALADAMAAHATELAKIKADNAAAVAAMKKAFNSLAIKWNKKNPTAKVALVK